MFIDVFTCSTCFSTTSVTILNKHRALWNSNDNERIGVYAEQDVLCFFFHPLRRKSSNEAWVSLDEDSPRIVNKTFHSKTAESAVQEMKKDKK